MGRRCLVSAPTLIASFASPAPRLQSLKMILAISVQYRLVEKSWKTLLNNLPRGIRFFLQGWHINSLSCDRLRKF